MRKLTLKALAGTLILGLGLAVLAAPSQPEKVYERYVQTPEMAWAEALCSRGEEEEGDIARGLALFAKVGAEHPGTTLGAVALLSQAKYSDSAQAVPIYQAVISAYPRTFFEISARKNLLYVQYGQTRAYFAAVERLAQSYGGPSLAELSRGDQSKASARVRALPLEYQKGLVTIYSSLHDMSEPAEAVPIAQFIRDTFFLLLDDNQASRDLQFDISMANIGTWLGIGDPMVNPTVRLLSHEREAGPRPKFVLELSTGPYPTPMIDLHSLKVKLDGQDFRPNLVASSRIKHHAKRAKGLSIEERIRVSGRPAQNLSRGPHTLDVEVSCDGYPPDGTGPGRTHKVYTFTVGRDRDDDEDDQDGECWDRS